MAISTNIATFQRGLELEPMGSVTIRAEDYHGAEEEHVRETEIDLMRFASFVQDEPPSMGTRASSVLFMECPMGASSRGLATAAASRMGRRTSPIRGQPDG